MAATTLRDERIATLVRAAQLNGEEAIGRFRIGVTLALAALVVLTVSSNDWRISVDDRWNIVAVVTGFTAGVIAVLVSRRGWYRAWFSYTVTALDVGMVTIALWTAQFGENSSIAAIVQTSSFLIYPISIILTARRIDAWNTIFATLLATVSYGAIMVGIGAAGAYGVVMAGTSSLGAPLQMEINVVNEVIRVAALVIAGAVAWSVERAQARLFRDGLAAQQEIERVTSTFGRYVSSDLAGQLLETAIEVTGEEREATVVFIDIVGFTGATERLKPAEVFAAINIFVSVVIDLANRHSGFINKFIGDAVMIVFGAPVKGVAHRERAVAFAADLAAHGPEIRRAIAEAGIEWDMQFGVGVNTGSVMLGNIGNDTRAEYTAIGDAVNVAARLEKEVHSKPEHGPVLVGAATVTPDHAEILHSVGSLAVRGRAEPLEVFALRRQDQ